MRICGFDLGAAKVEGIYIHEPARGSATRDELMRWVVPRLTGGARDRAVHHQTGEDA